MTIQKVLVVDDESGIGGASEVVPAFSRAMR